jgi:hypothetical protein
VTTKTLREAIDALCARRSRIERLIIKIQRHLGHISEHDLERLYLGMIPDGQELDTLEGHLLICGECVDRAEETAGYVDAMRAGIVRGKRTVRTLRDSIST